MADLAAQGRGLVHAAGRGLGDGVLGIDADRGERCAGMVIAQQGQVKEVGSGCGDGTFERCRAGEPGAQWHLAVHHEVEPADLVAGLLQGPENPSGVGAPARQGCRP